MSEATVVSTLRNWLGKRVQVRVIPAGSPTSVSTDGTLMHDQSLAPDSLDGWYVDIKASPRDDIGFATLDLGIAAYPERTLHELGGAGLPPQIALAGAGPLEIRIDALVEDAG